MVADSAKNVSLPVQLGHHSTDSMETVLSTKDVILNLNTWTTRSRCNLGEASWSIRAIKNMSFADPSLLRGSCVSHVLWGILDNGPPTSKYYDSSMQVDHLERFVSHNWSTPRWNKLLVLALDFNVTAAWLSVAIVTSVLTVLTAHGFLPFIELTTHGESWRSGVWCTALGSLTFLVALLCWHEVGRIVGCRGPTLFLDKACICQMDDQLKRQGIEHLASFLYYSWGMVVCYSESYFKKLWTVYEAASFLILHPGSCVDVRPVFLPIFVLGGFVMMLASTIMWHSLHTRIVQETISSKTVDGDLALKLIAVVLVATCASGIIYKWARERAQMSDHLQLFRLADAICFDENDRLLVQQNIVALMKYHGHVDETATDPEVIKVFEDLAHDGLPRLFAASLGRVGLPYRMVASMMLPHLLMASDCLGSQIFLGSPARQIWLTLVHRVTVALAVHPLAFALITVMAEYLIRRQCVRYSIAIVAMSVVALTFDYGMFSILRIIKGFGEDGRDLAAVFFIFIAVVLHALVLRIYWPFRYTRHRRRFECGSVWPSSLGIRV